MWVTITPNIYHPNGSRWVKRRVVSDIRVAIYAQTFPPFWIMPIDKSTRFKWVGEAFPPLYARYLFIKYNTPSGKLLDLFAGIGGWSLGYILTGRARYIEMVEIDREKCKYLELNFKKLKKLTEQHIDPWEYNVICKDIREYEPSEKFNIITGSPPCEDVSVLGALTHRYMKEIKGTFPLTQRYIEIVLKTNPSQAFYENVYNKKLELMLKNYGFNAEKHDMSLIIPQRRQRLIALRIRGEKQ